MKLDLINTGEVLKKCIGLCETLYELDASIKFLDRIISIKEFPDATSTERLDIMLPLISLIAKRHEEISEEKDELEITAQTLHP